MENYIKFITPPLGGFSCAHKQGIKHYHKEKAVYSVIEQTGEITLPNLYHNDGRAYFPRAGAAPGVVQGDAIRNITGRAGVAIGATNGLDGAFLPTACSLKSSGTSVSMSYSYLDVSRVVPTAEENRPLNISFIPAVYLGV